MLETQPDELNKPKFALVGLGFIAPRHKQAIERIGGEVLLTCDSDSTKHPDFTDWRLMTQSEQWKQISYVSLCVPNYLHCKMAQSMSDKIVLSEKPLGLSEEDINKIGDNVFTVLQLRHHPEVIKLKRSLRGTHRVFLTVKVKRDKSYWDCWKGDKEKSGGILFNLGIHYFDLLIYLFGNDYKILDSGYSDNKAQGKIDFNGTICDYNLEIMPDDNGQERSLEIDGETVVLSKQDNLSYEDLHLKVYQNLIKGRGIKKDEALKSIKLVSKLYGV